jgi:hypothetical protein
VKVKAYFSEPTYCDDPNHQDRMSWGHYCYGRTRQKGPMPEHDGGLFGYIASAKALIRDFDLGEMDDEGLVMEVSQEIAGAILDLGDQLKRERADPRQPTSKEVGR